MKRTPSIVDGLVDQGREIAQDVERGEDTLREQNTNQVLFGVTKPGGAQATIPTKAAWNQGKIVPPGHYPNPKSPAMGLEEARKRRQAGHRFLRGRQLVGGHHLDREP